MGGRRVSAVGSSLHADRPGACRSYPLGRGAAIDPSGQVTIRNVVIREDHYRGFAGPSDFAIADWLADQGIEEYNRENDRYLAFQAAWRRPGGPPRSELLGLALIALFRLDDFRDLILDRGILEELGVDEARGQAVLDHDHARLELHSITGSGP